MRSRDEGCLFEPIKREPSANRTFAYISLTTIARRCRMGQRAYPPRTRLSSSSPNQQPWYRRGCQVLPRLHRLLCIMESVSRRRTLRGRLGRHRRIHPGRVHRIAICIWVRRGPGLIPIRTRQTSPRPSPDLVLLVKRSLLPSPLDLPARDGRPYGALL